MMKNIPSCVARNRFPIKPAENGPKYGCLTKTSSSYSQCFSQGCYCFEVLAPSSWHYVRAIPEKQNSESQLT